MKTTSIFASIAFGEGFEVKAFRLDDDTLSVDPNVELSGMLCVGDVA